MKGLRTALLISCLAILSGCYAAKIDTGLPPSNTVIKKTFASCWIYGLVPPSTVETAAKCPNGVAVVETRLSFVNGLVGMITLGIYTPMQVVVTCADRPAIGMLPTEAEFTVSREAPTEAVQSVFAKAADEAARRGEPVLVYTTD